MASSAIFAPVTASAFNSDVSTAFAAISVAATAPHSGAVAP